MKNNRTFLEKLLDGAEVEWKPLIKVASLTRGRVISKEYLANNLGDYPVYSSQTVNNGEIGKINSFDFDGEFVSWTTDGANAGTVFYRSGKFSITNVCGLIKIQNNLELNYKFLFYWLSIEAKNHVYSGMGNPKLMSHQMEKILIPIPPLSVQTEIVKILDALTALTSELTSELTLRRKQYEYYREKLLSEEELGKLGGDWKNLKDVLINLRTGLNPRNNFKLNTDGAENYYITVRELDSVNIKITNKTDKINNQAREIIDKRSKLNIGDILFSGTGTIGKTAFISELPRNWNIKEGVYALTVNQEIIKPMYLLRLLQSEITKKQINNFVMGSTVKSISMADLKKVKILILSLDEQQRIVSILDKFETLTNSITEGLPLAIEQSQKRYEYYRELLLNFPGRE